MEVDLPPGSDWVHFFQGDAMVARKDPSGALLFSHPDHLGSTAMVTNQSGAVVENTTYEPYGAVFDGGLSRFQYTGKELDRGTGLEYYGARYYDPALPGMFTQPDSILPNPYDPQQLNRYAYVRNNPYKYTDPSGHVALFIPVAVGALVGAAFGAYVAYAANIDINSEEGRRIVGSYMLLGAITTVAPIVTAASGIEAVIVASLAAGVAATAAKNEAIGKPNTLETLLPMNPIALAETVLAAGRVPVPPVSLYMEAEEDAMYLTTQRFLHPSDGAGSAKAMPRPNELTSWGASGSQTSVPPVKGPSAHSDPKSAVRVDPPPWATPAGVCRGGVP